MLTRPGPLGDLLDNSLKPLLDAMQEQCNALGLNLGAMRARLAPDCPPARRELLLVCVLLKEPADVYRFTSPIMEKAAGDPALWNACTRSGGPQFLDVMGAGVMLYFPNMYAKEKQLDS